MPTSAEPGKWASTSAFSPSAASSRGRATTSTSSDPSGRARTYSISGPTAIAAFEIKVHGVVVQASRASPASSGDSGISSLGSGSRIGSLTNTEGSSTSW